MANSKKKYYVVWIGARPGVYDSWEACKAQVVSFPDAKYKSFASKEEAQNAFKQNYKDHYQSNKTENRPKIYKDHPNILKDSLAVDAACSGNPGIMEYRGVDVKTGQVVFHQGPFEQATNNIGEFLALVHALALLQKSGEHTRVIYSDSKTAISWVRNKKVKSELKKTEKNEIVFDLIDRALQWLNSQTWQNPVIKWETEKWGEIPADFGRK
jgi:ribonuclease HI